MLAYTFGAGTYMCTSHTSGPSASGVEGYSDLHREVIQCCGSAFTLAISFSACSEMCVLLQLYNTLCDQETANTELTLQVSGRG